MTAYRIRTLYIGNDPACLDSLSTQTRDQQGGQIDVQANPVLADGLQWVSDGSVDVVLLDLESESVDGLSDVRRVRQESPDVHVVVLSPPDGEATGLQAIQEGASDCLIKQRDGHRLRRVIELAAERRRADQSLRESEDRYRSLLQAVTSYIYTVELNNGQPAATTHGVGCLATTGYTAEDYAADPHLWWKMIHPRDRQRVERYVARILRGEKVRPIEHRVRRRDGSIRWIRNTVVPHFDATGRLLRYDGIVEDITRRKRLEYAMRRRDAQLIAANEIQEHMLPSAAPVVPGFDIAAAVYPAEVVAADLYDFVSMGNHTLGLIMGDVSGHGVAPALIMALTHMLLRSLVQFHTDAGRILTLTNLVLAKETAEMRFVSLFLGCLDPQHSTFTYASAGQPGYWLDASGNIKSCLKSKNVPLGICPDARFASSDLLALAPGDMILLFTDGVWETRSPQGTTFGIDRALSFAGKHRHKTAQAIVKGLYQAVRAFARHNRPEDDITILVAKVNPAGNEAALGNAGASRESPSKLA